MKNIKITIAYDGTNYHGWQKQSQLTTVGGVVEAGLKKLLSEPIRIICASRTDAGAHAYAQVINFSSETNLSPQVLPRALNSCLPKDIVVYAASLLPPEFHARFSAKHRRYRYLISNTPYLNVFLRNYAYWLPYQLNLKDMQQAGKFLIGRHNFTSFASRTKEVKNPVRQVMSLDLEQRGQTIQIEIVANAFLPSMVRSIVGSLIEVGKGKLNPAAIKEILEAQNHPQCHPIAPAYGLYLVEVGY